MSGPVSIKKNIEDLALEVDLKGKRVLVRVDLNAPLTKTEPYTVTDDTRLRAAIPTINFLKGKGAKVILISHLGRPKAKVVESLKMDPIASHLQTLLGSTVLKLDDCIGSEVEAKINEMDDGSVALLENVRFYAGEEKNDPEFAAKLASLSDNCYVNDAFGTAHRAHASTEGVTRLIKHSVGGYLMEKELKYLKGAIDNPIKPMGCIIGGAKVSSKITVIEALLEKCNIIILGGGMIFTFFKAQGYSVGKSLVEDEYVDLANTILKKAMEKGVNVILPTDIVVADKFDKDADSKTVSNDQIPDEWMGLDIGEKSINTFKEALSSCKTIVWNGPMGVFEIEKFAKGTMEIANLLAELTEQGTTTIIGGGDSVAAVEKSGLADKMSHISTGGGASLELLEGKNLPGVAALHDK
mmetsp:Transcript_15012/g.22353  ORF Transcript_15012/g.22353 Transcript_15012/m.22353 type:complete len:411 (+) Transcript_15012:63-1295(+)